MALRIQKLDFKAVRRIDLHHRPDLSRGQTVLRPVLQDRYDIKKFYCVVLHVIYLTHSN